jgi:hypothetical protein
VNRSARVCRVGAGTDLETTEDRQAVEGEDPLSIDRGRPRSDPDNRSMAVEARSDSLVGAAYDGLGR